MERVVLRTERKTLADLAYEHILSEILTRKLKPGDSLCLEQMAEAMSISVTPVKQALSRLAGEGLVRYEGGRFPCVAVPTDDELRELYDCRLMCEQFAVREGMDRVDRAFLEKMADHMARCEAALAAQDGGYEAHVALAMAERALHSHVVTLAGNKRMLAWYLQQNVHITACRISEIGGIGAWHRERIPADHRAIYEAIERKDAVAASEAIRQHIIPAREMLLKLRQEKASQVVARIA